MKKNLLSLFLALVMLIGIASAFTVTAGAENDFRAWIQDGKLYWDKVDGAAGYVLYFFSTSTGGEKNGQYSDMPFDLADHFTKNYFRSNTYTISVKARDSEYNGIAYSNELTFEYTTPYPSLPTPEARIDGTTIRWNAPDLKPFASIGVASGNTYTWIFLRSSDRTVPVDCILLSKGLSVDVSKYIEDPDAVYWFEIHFQPKDGLGVFPSETYTTERVTGRQLKSGYVTPDPGDIPAFEKGDVNMDKTLDNADLILVARYVVNLYNFGSEAFKLGDMDNSGAIDNSDLIRLARLLVGLS
jgi:hypothetical protein